MMPNFVREFLLYTEACDGGLLCQEDADKKTRPVALYSRKLEESERKYTIGVYLYGKEFVVRTDHRPLEPQEPIDKASTMVDNR